MKKVRPNPKDTASDFHTTNRDGNGRSLGSSEPKNVKSQNLKCINFAWDLLKECFLHRSIFFRGP